jgi:hypothetical protein
MYMQSLFILARTYFSRLATAKVTRGQGLSEYLGLLIGLGVIIVLVVAIIAYRLLAKANSASW